MIGLSGFSAKDPHGVIGLPRFCGQADQGVIGLSGFSAKDPQGVIGLSESFSGDPQGVIGLSGFFRRDPHGVIGLPGFPAESPRGYEGRQEKLWSECWAFGGEGGRVKVGPYVTWDAERVPGAAGYALRSIETWEKGKRHGPRRVFEGLTTA